MTNPFGRGQPQRRDDNPFGRGNPDQPINAWDAFGLGAGDAITFGWGDELVDRFGAQGEGERLRNRMEVARAYQGGAFMGGQFAGALGGGAGLSFGGRAAIGAAGLAPTAARVAARMGPLSRIGVGAGTGAAGGALYGAGDSPDGMRLQGAGSGAMFGAAFGAGGQALGEVAGRVGGAIGRSLSPEARAANMIGGMQNRFGQTGDDLATSLRDAPEGAMVLDVIPGGTQIASGAAARPGVEREALRGALDARNVAGVQQSIDDIWQSLGGSARRSGSSTLDDMAKAQKAQASPLYESSLNRPMDMGRAQTLLRPIVERNPRLFALAEERANAIALSETGRRFGPDNPRYWHYLKQGADEAFESLRNPMSGQGGLGPAEQRAYARALHGYRLQLGRILGPEYRQADAIWGGLQRQQNSLRLGFEAVGTKADDLALGDIARSMRRMSAGELETMRLGALAKMSDMLENANSMTGRADPVRALIRNAGQRRVLEQVFGGTQQLNSVIRRLEQRQEMFRNSVEVGVGVNSHTADRLLAYQSQVAQTNPTQGGIKDAVLRMLTGDAADAYNEAVSNQILQTLRTPARQALQEINAAGGVQKWSEGRGLLSRAVRERNRLAQQRQRALASAVTTGLYTPVVGGSVVDFGGM